MNEGRIQITYNHYTNNDWFSYGVSLDQKHVHAVVNMDMIEEIVWKASRPTQEQIDTLCPVCKI